MSHLDNDYELFVFSDEEEISNEDVVTEYWNILIVDDEEAVHQAIKIALKDTLFNGKSLCFYSAFNSVEAEELLKNTSDIAVVFLDVSMSKVDDGLLLVDFIRKTIANSMMRIILITGHSDIVFGQRVILEYDINDFKAKTELSVQRLYTSLIAALRSYNDMVSLAKSRDELSAVNESYNLKVRAVNASKTGIAISDGIGNITWTNSSFLEIAGFDEDTILGDIWERILVKNRVKKAYGKNDYTFIHRDGRSRIAEVKYEDVLDHDGSIKSSVIALQDITEREKSRKDLYKDIELARKVQNSVFPPEINTSQMCIKGTHKSFEKLGGDMFYWEELDEDTCAIALIDVMGHGIATSLITMYIRSLLPDAFKSTRSPGKVMEILQRAIVEFNALFMEDLDYYFTSVILVVDFAKGTITYVNAGHPSVILMFKDGYYEMLESMIMPIGVFEYEEIPEKEYPIIDIVDILLYTDGFSEAKNVDLKTLLHMKIDRTIEGSKSFKRWFELIEKEDFDDDVSMIWMSMRKGGGIHVSP